MEFDWACGITPPAGFVEPEPWVRYAIRRYWGIPDDLAHNRKISRENIATLFGYAEGLCEASEAALNAPIPQMGLAIKDLGKLQRFQAEIAKEMQPHWEKVRQTLANVPRAEYAKTLGEVSAVHAGQKFGSDFVRDAVSHDGPDDNATRNILWFLWMFWPELSVFRSVAELHRWFEETRFLFCGQKIVEKTCTKIGFRPGARGRKKRIPTSPR